MISNILKRALLVLALLVSSSTVLPLSAHKADSTYVTPQHSIYFEIGGASDFIGLNYDMRLKKASPWGIRAGLNWAYQSQNPGGKNNFVGFSTEFNRLIGGKRNHFEVGIGNKLLFIHHKYDGAFYYEYPTTGNDITTGQQALQPIRKDWVRDLIYLDLGYRHETPHGFQFRCGITPFVNVTHGWTNADGGKVKSGEILFAPYVSLGWAF